MSYQYNEARGRTRTTWPDGYHVAYGFDALNRMSSATENGSVALASYTLDALSRRTLLQMGGVATNQIGYSYESDSDLDVLTQTMNGTTVTLDHGHNASHQLSGIAANDDFYLVRPAALTSRAYVPNALNEYGSFAGSAVTNDLNGNLLTWYPPDGSGKQTYTYDSENRLTSAAINGSGTATILYDYDGLGRRASKTVSGVATTYLLDGDEEIAEYNGSTLLRRYVTGPTIDDRVARAEGSGTSNPTKTYYHTNHQGSVIAITSPAGTVSQRLAYDEYGTLTSGAVTSGEQFRYTGRRFDAETGLYYYRARYYSPALGRFLQVDPIGYEDDVNLYTYVGNDPADKTDPTGKFCWFGSFGNSCNGSTQGFTAWLGQNLWRTSDARSAYTDKTQSLKPTDGTSRTEGKGSARAATPEPARSVVQAMRPDKGSRTGSTSSANKTNPAWDRAGKVAGVVGKASVVTTVAIGATEIATSDNPGRAASGVAGAAAGGIAGGEAGATGGAVIGGMLGGPPGAAVGAIVGGVLGSAGGGVVGHDAGTAIYDETAGP